MPAAQTSTPLELRSGGGQARRPGCGARFWAMPGPTLIRSVTSLVSANVRLGSELELLVSEWEATGQLEREGQMTQREEKMHHDTRQAPALVAPVNQNSLPGGKGMPGKTVHKTDSQEKAFQEIQGEKTLKTQGICKQRAGR